MIKKSIILFSCILLFLFPIITAEEFGYNYLEGDLNIATAINYSTINVNNSQFLRGLTPQQVADLSDLTGYVPYTGATANLIMPDYTIWGKTLRGDDVWIWDDTLNADAILSMYTHDISNSFVLSVTDAGSTDFYSGEQYQFRSGDNLFQIIHDMYTGTYLNIDVGNTFPEITSKDGTISFVDENLTTTGNITADWFFASDYFSGQPIDGGIGSGIIQADEFLGCGCINVTDNGIDEVTYTAHEHRIVSTDGTTNYCYLPEDTVTITSQGYSVYYVDSNCVVQSETFPNYYDFDIHPGDYSRIFDVYKSNGEIEDSKGASLIELVDRKSRRLNVDCGGEGHLKICDGMNIQENTFPYFNQTSGHYVHINSEVSTTQENTETDGMHFIYRTAGDWVHVDGTGLNLTHCDDGTDLVECSTPSLYRRYYVGSIGWTDTRIHQLAGFEDEVFVNIGNCLDTETYPLGDYYTIPPRDEGILIIHSVYCGRASDSDWTGSWITIGDRATTGGGTPDFSPYVPYTGANQNLDLGSYNITASNFFGNLIGTWNGSSDYYLNSNPNSYYNLTTAPTYINDTFAGNYSDYLTLFNWNKTYADTLYYDLGNSFGYYNSTNPSPVINESYYLKTNPFSFYNSTNPQTETDPYWTANQSSYSTTAEIITFGYYNETDFVITDYFTKTELLNFNYYNSTDFSISDYALLSTLNNGTYNYDWNETGLIINWSGDYLTEETLWNANYSEFLTHIDWSEAVNGTLFLSSEYNATGLIINWSGDYLTLSELLAFDYYNSTILNSLSQLNNDLGIGNWTLDKPDYSTTTEADNLYVNLTGDIMTGNLTAYNFLGNLSWNYLKDYPVACPGGSAITQLGDSVVCSSFTQANTNVTFLNVTASNFFGNLIGTWNGSSNYLLNTGDTATGDYNFKGDLTLDDGSKLLIKDVGGQRTTTLEHTNDNNFEITTSVGGIEFKPGGTLKALFGQTADFVLMDDVNFNFGSSSDFSMVYNSANDRMDWFDKGRGTGITLNNLGNVGINRVNPTALLDIQQKADTSSDGIKLISNTSAVGRIYMSGGDLVLQQGGNDNQLYLDNTGYVGIGTTTPSSKLEVLDGNIVLREDDDVNDAVKIFATNTYGGISFKLDGVTNTEIKAEGVSFFNGGNVGIGITNPTKKIEVQSSDTTLAFGNGAFEFGATANWGGLKRIFSHRQDVHQIVVNEDSQNLDFRIEGDGDVNLFFTDASTDRIGIGDITPSYKLDVTGQIRATQGRVPAGYISSAFAETQNELFDVLSPFLSNTGDEMIVSGSLYKAGTYYSVSRARRLSSTIIRFDYMTLDGTVGGTDATDGSATAIKYYLAW